MDMVTAGLRLQAAAIDAMLKAPAVSLALKQQTLAYNIMLGLVGAKPFGRDKK